MNKAEGRSTINIKRLTMWKQLVDTENTLEYETEPHKFENQMQTARYTPSMQTAPQYGDGIKVEDYAAKDGGTIDIGIRGYADGDEEFLYGNTKNSAGVITSNSGDVVPYVCVAYATERPDHTLNLYKFPRTKLTPQGEDSRQREGTSINYATTTLSGTYSPTINNGDDMHKIIGVDPKVEADAEFIEKWFTEPLFIGETTTDEGTETG
ncbi:MAG: hypothetical protein IJZ47_09770 [Oscillospiraceae bacterium]|nr:hypothetical protein [Oscillospiraceae bacterium]